MWVRERERVFNIKNCWKFSSDDWWRFLWKRIPKMEQRAQKRKKREKRRERKREREEDWIVWSGRIKTIILFKRNSSQDGITIVPNQKFSRIILCKIYWLPSSQNYTEFYWKKQREREREKERERERNGEKQEILPSLSTNCCPWLITTPIICLISSFLFWDQTS